jgi:hypothetical protein
MRWPWQRQGSEADHARADAAIETSREQRAEASRLAEDARRRAARWRRWQEDNHFAEGFRRALGDGR